MTTHSNEQPTERCYFAHHVTDYNTPRETGAIERLEVAGLDRIFNPNSAESQAGYKEHGMPYFVGIVATCAALAYQRFPNGAIGAGVAKEITAAMEHGLPIYEVTESGVEAVDGAQAVADGLTVDETRALLGVYRAAKKEAEEKAAQSDNA